jgi:hypothetical protein
MAAFTAPHRADESGRRLRVLAPRELSSYNLQVSPRSLIVLFAFWTVACGETASETPGDGGSDASTDGSSHDARSDGGDTGTRSLTDVADAELACTGYACKRAGGLAGVFCGGVCCAGACCAGACTDTLTDSSNCGGCGYAVPIGAQCAGGLPVQPVRTSCTSAPVNSVCALNDGGTGLCCGGQCEGTEAFDTDPGNCGACRNACLTTQSCSGGSCTGGTCDPPQTCPPGYIANACSCDLLASSCSAATEGLRCDLPGGPLSGMCCGSSCAERTSDPANCGTCGNACAAGQVCVINACVAPTTCTVSATGAACRLPTGFTGSCCGDSCVDFSSDSSNCGVCGLSCAPPATCVDDECYIPGASVPGQCNVPGQASYFACPAGTQCEQDSIGYGCVASVGCTAAGEFACDNGSGNHPSQCCAAGDAGCPNIESDPNNCGGCGVVCASRLCIAGSCFPSPGPGCSSAGSCPSGTAYADGYCVALASACTDGNNNGPLCAAPGAALGICCTHQESNPYCADPLNDPSNCGGCHVVCASCVNGKCQGDAGQ